MTVKLRIRPEQMRAFSEVEARKFEDWMSCHLKRFFPSQCEALGGTAILETIRYGKARCRQHGFKVKADVCKYIDLMMVLGRDFDTDPQFGWAAAILGRSGDRSATMRALFAAASRRQPKQ